MVATSEAIVERLRALPGVEAAAAAGQIPLGGNGDTWGFHVDGGPPGPDDPSVERYAVTPDYFSVMRIPLRRGRLFTAADRADSTNVIILGEANRPRRLARRRSDRPAGADRRTRRRSLEQSSASSATSAIVSSRRHRRFRCTSRRRSSRTPT